MKHPLFPQIPHPLLLAHRGCSFRCPENTMPAFRMAEAEQIPGIELDIQLSADGEIMVFHDQSLDRICGVRRNLNDLSSRELHTLDAGSWKSPTFAGTRIPLLKEVLEGISSPVLFDIELKYYRPGQAVQLAETLAGILDDPAFNQRVCLSSFDPRLLKAARKVLPGLPCGLIYDSDSLPAWLPVEAARIYCGANFLKPDHRLLVQKRARRIPALCWTVDSELEAAECVKKGAVGIISNRPEELIGGFYR